MARTTSATPASGERSRRSPSRAGERLVRFWDTSALIPLVVAERATARVERWLRQDPVVVVWTLTRVELLSALARRRREERAAARRLAAARREVLSAWPRWS